MNKFLLSAIILIALTFSAQAQTATKTSATGNPCTPTSCSGAYFGGYLAGNGTNANIIGNGISGSVFSGGGQPGATIGYQFANGTYFFAGEAGIGYEVNPPTSVNGQTTNATGLFAYEIAKVGGNLSGLLGNIAPITPPTVLTQQLISPYVSAGAVERQYGTGWATGAGATFDITNKLFLDISYLYVGYGSGIQVGAVKVTNENWVRVGLDYKFGF